jgi:hypothetical protein
MGFLADMSLSVIYTQPAYLPMKFLGLEKLSSNTDEMTSEILMRLVIRQDALC